MPAAQLEYEVLGGQRGECLLRPGEVWTFGRSARCSVTLVVPELSRVALVLHSLVDGVVRVTSRQSNRGRVAIASDDGVEQHGIGLGSAPVHLTGGNYTLKLELPLVVLRMHAAVPAAASPDEATTRLAAHHPGATARNWSPNPGAGDGQEWIGVAALAVALVRYPALVERRAERAGPVTLSEALRLAAQDWFGHGSHYWVNARLKEAVAAADLDAPEGGERLRLVAAHYAHFFSDATIRTVRQELERLQSAPKRDLPNY